MSTIGEEIDRIAVTTRFSGAVRVDVDGVVVHERAYGLADRAHTIPNAVDTQFALASGSKGFTALAVVSIIAEGRLGLDTPAREVLGRDLPLIADDVTIEHLLSHRSGIGDYLDENDDLDVTDYVMTVPVHELATTEDFVRVLDGHPTKFPAGERFSYCNGAYVVLALIAERVTGVPFHDLVEQRVCAPAGLHDTAFLRSDELPGRAAVGYLGDDDDRTNVFHLPVRGNGDGGIYSTLTDVRDFWPALFAGRIVSTEWVRRMVAPHSDLPSEARPYGLGFSLHSSLPIVMLEGSDAGVSFRTTHDPITRRTYTVVSNTSLGAWPIVRHLVEVFG